MYQNGRHVIMANSNVLYSVSIMEIVMVCAFGDLTIVNPCTEKKEIYTYKES